MKSHENRPATKQGPVGDKPATDVGITARHAPPGVDRHAELFLQRTIGNQASSRLLQGRSEAAGTSLGGQLVRSASASEGAQEEMADRVAGTAATSLRVASHVHDALQDHSVPATVDDTLRRSGEPLDPTTRAEMESLLGHGFGDVRVHRGTDAARSASALGAAAYTRGKHIAFARERFDPHSADGKGLLAHELAHVVQQANSSATLQLKADPDVPDEPAADLTDKLSDAIRDQIWDAILQSKLPSELTLKRLWGPIRHWIVKLRGKAPDLDPALAKALAGVPEKDRVKIADTVYDRLASAVGTETPDIYRKEFALLSRRVRELLEPSNDIAGYVAMRRGLKATFGSIKAANKFYDTLVPADFPPGSSILGTQSLVHKELKAALNRTAALLAKRNLTDAVRDHLTGIETIAGNKHQRGYWATSIRENRNRPSEIGNHSFGFAIDFNSDWNPNLPKFPWEHVKRRTGFDVFGPDIAKARSTESFETVETAARRFKAASDKFRKVFDSEADLEKAMVEEAESKGASPPPAGLFKAVVAASEGRRHPRKGADAKFEALVSLLAGAIRKHEDDRKRDEPMGREQRLSFRTVAHEDPLVLSTIVAGLKPKVRSKKDVDRIMPVVEAQISNPKDKPASEVERKELSFLFGKQLVTELRKVQPSIRTFEMPGNIRRALEARGRTLDATELANYLVELHGIFVSTRRPSKTGGEEKVDIGTPGTLATVAAHGFVDLMPELVAALTSRDGGGLRWLGAVGKTGKRPGTKDWMHFELVSPPRIEPEGEWETDRKPREEPPDPAEARRAPHRGDTDRA